jgi:hypothetical protein
MFEVYFDFDYEDYKKNIAKYKRQKTLPYHFTEPQRRQIYDACKLLPRLSGLATQKSPRRDSLLRQFFGTDNDPSLGRHLRLMHSVISSSAKRVIFVDGSKRRVRVRVNPYNLDAPQVLMDTPYPASKMKWAGAWTHTLPGNGSPRKPGDYHVGSGYRIILGQAFPFGSGKRILAGVVYHELTHKILGTNDYKYGERACWQLARTNSAKAIKNADNYNFFISRLGRP